MRTRSPAEIAEYFGVDASIASFVPTLLADFYELGGFPHQITAMLAPLGLGKQSRVLDVGCGKGAVAIELARALGFGVHGVDMLESFIQQARQRAAAEGVEALCTFECADAHELLGRPAQYDVVLLISVGEIFGALDSTVSKLRTLTRPGGYLVIDDGYLPEGVQVSYRGWEHLASRAETIRRLSCCGDTLVREVLIGSEQMSRMNQEYNRRIQRRARELAQQHPEHAAALDAYLARQREESRLLENRIQCATWLLRVDGPPGPDGAPGGG